MTKHCRQDSAQNEVFLMNIEARVPRLVAMPKTNF